MEKTNFGYSETQPTETQITKTKSKGGRLQNEKYNLQNKLAYDLYCRNLNQKEISKQLGITPKTVSKWAKIWKQTRSIEKETLANLKSRLLEMTNNKTTPITEIKNLVSVIMTLESN
jgi:predicted transcriptional regulator